MSNLASAYDGRIAAVSGRGDLRDFWQLLKPRVMSLVVFTGFAGMMAAPGHIHWFLGAVAVLCIALAAGAAGCINMWLERDLDAKMKRTASRPLPAGRVDPDEALALGVVMTLVSILIMGVALNWLAAGLLAAASAFYIFIYTLWLKPRTPQNIVIGGAAGAFPPMIGWAAVTGDITLASFALFAIIFFWTPPHFWALALFVGKDYARAGIPMLPVVAGEAETRRQILLYSLLLAPLATLPWWLGTGGMIYLTLSLTLGGLFVYAAFRVWREAEGQYHHARRLFAFSVLYLALLFAGLILEALL